MRPEVAIMLMVFFAAAIIVWALFLRFKRHELRHQERMTALEKGAELPAEPPEKPPVPWSPRLYLLRGLIWLFTGAGLSAFLLGLSLTIVGHTENFEDRLWRAQNLRRNGATEEEVKQFLSQSQNQNVPRDRIPAGVSLIGLIPMGVGLAYLIYYRGDSHRPPDIS